MGMTPRTLGLATAAAVFALDRAHKLWMLDIYGVATRPPLRLLPFLDLVLAWNRGVSYSLFASGSAAGRWLLLAVACVAIAVLLVWMWRARRVTALGLGLVVGGAAGNACDRLIYGAVADFFHFHTPFSLGPLSNYVFNVADVGIVAGVALLLYESLFLNDDAPVSGDATQLPESRG
jgi:signal peptidase II